MSAEGSQITGQRKLTVERLNGPVAWKVTEFEGGNVMLTADAAGSSLSVGTHFDAEQWAQFVQFIAGGQS